MEYDSCLFSELGVRQAWTPTVLKNHSEVCGRPIKKTPCYLAANHGNPCGSVSVL